MLCVIMFLCIFILDCPEACKCKTGGANDGGKEVNDQGYCEHHCSKWGHCGNSVHYLDNLATNCTGCKILGKMLIMLII